MIVMSHGATYMSPGDTFDFRCTAEPLKPNMVIQIVKTKMEYVGQYPYIPLPSLVFQIVICIKVMIQPYNHISALVEFSSSKHYS